MNRIKSITYFIWFLWLFVVVLGCIHALIHYSSVTSVSSIYYHAGLRWLHEQPLYNNKGTRFIYLPQSAAFYIPFSILPFYVAEILWRLVAILFFAISLIKFSELVEFQNTKLIFILMSIFTIPLSITIAQNGQMHLFIMGFLCFSALAIIKEQWWLAAILLAIAIAFKPTAFIVYLLFAILYPKLWLRVITTTFFVFLLPFILQKPHYVLSQYQMFIDNFTVISHIQGTHPQHWAQIFTIVTLLMHYQFSALMQTLIRLAFAFLTLGCCFYCKQKFSPSMAIIYIFTLGIVYLMLFNARTENNDYVMLMPFIGLFFIITWQTHQKIASIYVFLIALLIAANHSLSKLLMLGNNHWLKPSMTVLFAVFLIVRLLTSKSNKIHT